MKASLLEIELPLWKRCRVCLTVVNVKELADLKSVKVSPILVLEHELVSTVALFTPMWLVLHASSLADGGAAGSRCGTAAVGRGNSCTPPKRGQHHGVSMGVSDFMLSFSFLVEQPHV